MRSKDCGIIPGVGKEASKEASLEMFKRMCYSRYFELQVKRVFDQGLIKMPIYLSMGQESLSSALSIAFPNSSSEFPTHAGIRRCEAIFAQHRCHDIYLSYGGSPEGLRDELLHRPTGCAGGMGGSASIHDPSIGMFGHDGLMGTQIPIAVGYALATGKPTLAVMGDASAEEDYVLGAMAYAASKKATILFVCCDNGLSILTKVEARRSWKMADIAAALGMSAVEITDDPWLIMHHAKKLPLPAFINVHTVRHWWHSGTGTDGPPEWDRFSMVKDELAGFGFSNEIQIIEEEAKKETESLWEKE